jgi:hypothetical protein
VSSKSGRSPPSLHILASKKFYVDKCLSFGLRYDPGIFNSVAEVIQWIAKKNSGYHT